MPSMQCDPIVAGDETMRMIRTYSELIRFKTFEERYNYLRLGGIVGEDTFGYERYLNQMLYKSSKWRATRNNIIIRDDGCDLAIEDRGIYDRIIVHHINSITIDDIEFDRKIVYDPENLICTSLTTHNAIHYGDGSKLTMVSIERKPKDTCPWL
jgi:hypothetical protein